MTDADSLVYTIGANGVLEDFHMNKDMFDFNKYPDNSRFYDMKNKKLIAKMKDETKHVFIADFIRLKCKMYSYIKKR